MKFNITLKQTIDYNETVVGEADNYTQAVQFMELALAICPNCSVTMTAYESNVKEEE